MKNILTPRSLKKIGASIAVASGLALGSAGIASAVSSTTSASQPSANSPGGSGATNGEPGTGDAQRALRPPACPNGDACLGGKIQSITSSNGGYTIIVTDREGFWRTIQTGSSTTFSQVTRPVSTPSSGSSGTSASSPATPPTPPTPAALDPSTLKAGDFVSAQGSVDANHTTLNASSVTEHPAPPNGQQGPGQQGFGGPPNGQAPSGSSSTPAF